MTIVNKETFLKLTTLCKFDFPEVQKEEKFTDDLNAIIQFVGKVNEYGGAVYDDTADGKQVGFDDLREDVAVVTATPEQLMRNTQSDNNCYIIPRVVD